MKLISLVKNYFLIVCFYFLQSPFFSGYVYARSILRPEVVVYYQSGADCSPEEPDYYASLDNLEKLADKVVSEKSTNFSRLVISSMQPSLKFYDENKESLSCTGLFGEFCDQSTLKMLSAKKNLQHCMERTGRSKFSRLKNVVSKFQESGIQVFLSLGGWNFSCHRDYYEEYFNSKNSCGPQDSAWSIFPNPLERRSRFDSRYSTEDAKDSYRKVVQLATALGVDGIDIDYQEVWHAHLNAHLWNFSVDAVEGFDTAKNRWRYITTEELMSYGQGDYIFDGEWKDKRWNIKIIIPETVDKFAAIIRELRNNIRNFDPRIKLSVVTSAFGAIPTMTTNHELSQKTVGVFGGSLTPAFGGVLYGLIYDTALRYPKEIDSLVSIGVNAYDLQESAFCKDVYPCPFADQAKFLYGTFLTWLKSGDYAVSGSDNKGTLDHILMGGSSVDDDSQLSCGIRPKKLLIKPPIYIGFQVGQPKYGNLPLTKEGAEQVLQHARKLRQDGAMVWNLFKDVIADRDSWEDEWARPQEIIKECCYGSGLHGSSAVYNYDCESKALDMNQEEPEAADNVIVTFF